MNCDGIDNNCDGTIDPDSSTDVVYWYIDHDGDGYGTADYQLQSCNAPQGYVDNTDDCNDLESLINPGITEACNGIDDDCDGVVDPDTSVDVSSWYSDTDEDGFGESSTMVIACDAPQGHVLLSGDCDDGSPEINPSMPEICNGFDDDCDGVVDPDTSVDVFSWYLDSDADGFGIESDFIVGCEQPSGYALANEDGFDCDDQTQTTFPLADEQCNGVDDNCDGVIDENGDDACGVDEYCDSGVCLPICEPGELDSDFGINGLARVALGGDDILSGMAVQSDGSILLTGSNGSGLFLLTRLTPSGEVDRSFMSMVS